ncbi:MAG: type II toxin-antitoxin system RelE/ParE family toxin [Nitrososphaerota archaeon]|jgi:addiction module RelE/StbE family toxin|nr:type II toxin-antitoxin system RelE/ParE family toxin [Nitrososphaerota archaeon]
MKTNSKIILSKAAIKQLDNLDKPVRLRVFRELKQLENNPLAGKALTGDLQGARTFRVGKYRIIYQMSDYNITVLTIKHRKKVYNP